MVPRALKIEPISEAALTPKSSCFGQQNVTYPLSFHEVQLRKTVDPEWNLKNEVEFKDEAGRKKKSLWKKFNPWK